MAQTIFSTTVRVVMCKHCGAPVETPLQGGNLHCTYCGVALQVVPRRQDRSLAPPQTQPVDEQERLNRLRAQDGKPLLPPSSLQSLMQGGTIPAWKIQEAVAVWQSTRDELAASPSNFEAGQRLLFLTMVLANHFAEAKDPMRRRAMFEGALDVLELPRHRQVILGYLSRAATIEGDLEAAAAWLAPCDPGSDDLETDTAYRISRATLDTARGDFNAVHEVLGANQTDVPIMDAADGLATVLRANAWERLGQPDRGVALLEQYMAAGGASGRAAVKGVVGAFGALNVCQQSLRLAEAQYGQQASRAAAARSGGLVGTIFFFVGIGLLAGAGIGVVAGIAIRPALFSMVPGMVIPGVIMFLLGRGMKRSAARAAHLRQHGVQAQGTVVNLATTGTRINNVPQYRVTLSIQLEGKAPYQAETKLLLQPHDAAQLGPGTVLPVRVDPNNQKDVMLELD